jgi:hypothetical protein
MRCLRRRTCWATTTLLSVILSISHASASSFWEHFNEQVRELGRKLTLCIIDRDKCLPVEHEAESECHLDDKNRICCEIRRSVIVELDTKLRELETKEPVDQDEGKSSDWRTLLTERLSDPNNVAHQAHDAAEALKDVLGLNPRVKAELERGGGSEETCVEFTRQQVLRDYTSVLQQLLQSSSSSFNAILKPSP